MTTIVKTYDIPTELDAEYLAHREAVRERLRKQRVFVNGTRLPFLCQLSVDFGVLPRPQDAETAPRSCLERVDGAVREFAYSNGYLTIAGENREAFLDAVAGERGGTFLDKPFTLVVQTLDDPDAPDPKVVSEDRYLLCRVTEMDDLTEMVFFSLYVGLAVPSNWQTQDSRYCQLLRETFPTGVPGC